MRLLQIVATASLVLACLSCKDKAAGPEEVQYLKGALGKPIQLGSIKFELFNYGLRYLEVCSRRGCKFNKQPFFVLEVKLVNTGKVRNEYSPRHREEKKSKARYPYLTDTDGMAVDPVIATAGQFSFVGQARDADFIAPGKEVIDRFIYVNPGRDTKELTWEFPGILFLARAFVTFKLPLEYKPPTKPEPQPFDKKWEFGKTEVSFTETKTAFGELERGDDVGCTGNPYFQVLFSVKNPGDKIYKYKPIFNHPKGDAAHLFDQEGNRLKRAFYGPSITVKGQQPSTLVTKIPPKETINEMIMFDRPPRESTHVILELGQKAFGSRGVMRVKVPYTHVNLEDVVNPCKEKEKEEKKKKGKKGKKGKRGGKK